MCRTHCGLGGFGISVSPLLQHKRLLDVAHIRGVGAKEEQKMRRIY